MDHATPAVSAPTHSRDKWEVYRETIIHLYLDRSMSLRRLMVYMKDHYDFTASPQLYKSHFSRWGVGKNVTAARILSGSALDSAPQRNIDVAQDRPLNVSSERRRTYFRRLPHDRRSALVRDLLEPLAASPSAVVPRAPSEELLFLEECLHKLDAHVKGHSEGNVWPRHEQDGFAKETVVPTWCSPVMSASRAFDEGKTPEVRRFLRQFFRKCPNQLQRVDPLLFPFIYTSALFFSRKCPPIAQGILRKLLSLVSPPHPLWPLIEVNLRLGPRGMLRHTSRILLAYNSMIYQALGAAYPIVQYMLADSTDRLLRYDLASAEEVANLIRRMLTAAEADNRDRCIYNSELRMRLAEAYMIMGDTGRARQTFEEIMSPENDDIRGPRMLPEWHTYMSRVNEADDLQGEAIASALKAVIASIEIYGEYADWTVNSLVFYRQVLERAGEADRALEVSRHRDMVMDQLCSKLENLEV
ncbi:Clr5 domain-containing protein [Xylariaceae sp. FL0804]|nr:Clr5 domain-containing protein [Xylariaceae sp. FL0804]